MTGRKLERNTVIVGMGKTGLSCARYLARSGRRFTMLDTREFPPMLEVIREEFPDIDIYLGKLSEEVLLQAGQIIISPGVSLNEPVLARAKEAGIAIIGDIELFSRIATAPVFAITGSNGKSTVTSLLAEMANADSLKAAVGANLGTPALDLLAEDDIDTYILELSSFQLETVSSLNAKAAVVLNITDDHMDRYECIDDYATAKARIFNGDGVMILNRDDPLVMKMQRPHRTISTFSLNEPVADNYGIRNYGNEVWLVKGQEKIIARSGLKLVGDHNVANALAAIALADVMKVRRSSIKDVLRSFAGLPHRCQWVAKINDVNWYNDSKGTNIGASIAAIKGLGKKGKIILIAGGDSKGADFSVLADIAKEYLCGVVLIGRDAPRIRQVLEGLLPLADAIDMPSAVNAANKIAAPGDIVLLSPACASIDMFENYQARGETFINAVKKLMVS